VIWILRSEWILASHGPQGLGLRSYLESKHQGNLDTTHQHPNSARHAQTSRGTPFLRHLVSISRLNTSLAKLSMHRRTHVIIIETLAPGDQTQHRQNLRLNQKRDVEIASNVVCA